MATTTTTRGGGSAPAATVNVKLTPGQWDLLRNALSAYRAQQLTAQADTEATSTDRRHAGEQAARAKQLQLALGIGADS